MKPKRFAPGQHVTPSMAFNNKLNGEQATDCIKLKQGEIYTIHKYNHFMESWWVELEEKPFDVLYKEDFLEPVVTDSVLNEELSEIFTPQEV